MIQQQRLEQTHWKNWFENRDSEAAEELILKYMPLVDYHVQRISAGLPASVSKDELKSLGMVGLYEALRNFDADRELKFNTYASFRVKGAILDGLRKLDWLPRSTREKTKRLEAASEKLEQKFLRRITTEELARETGMDESEVVTVLQESTIANLILMDDAQKDGVQLVDNKRKTPEQQYMMQELMKELAEAIKQLNEKEQLVVSFFYEQELTLTEIGQILDLSTSRISQIHSKALYKLRNVLKNVI